MKTVPSLREAVELAQRVGARLRERHLMCATAESCTGGLIGHLITEVPGCSDYFAGGAIVYSYGAKEAVVDVDHDILLREGAVSASVAQLMAQGALRRYAAGVAGCWTVQTAELRRNLFARIRDESGSARRRPSRPR